MNVTTDNVGTLVNNLTTIVTAANDTEDQITANIRAVLTVLTQTAALFQSPATLAIPVIQPVVVEEVGHFSY